MPRYALTYLPHTQTESGCEERGAEGQGELGLARTVWTVFVASSAVSGHAPWIFPRAGSQRY